MTTKRRKMLIRAVVALVLLLDVALVAANYRLTASPEASSEQLRQLRRRRDLMAADIRRASDIRKSLPDVEAQSTTFYEKDLRPAGTGFSSAISDLDSLAKGSGLQITSAHFREKNNDKRGVDEVAISISMEGAYPSLVSFINGLERSGNFYLLDSLSLDSSTEGKLRLNLELRTYFRS
ncbi:MAG TPA: type 4a pilus biogenesis protein PilO [Candidatus Acidoferrales bacterium]|jgi:Tfp pilus assembly protein PilO|nr:type 4a pilus biogenesis protein PilO [Candidatus Acidoferrales bacterium]